MAQDRISRLSEGQRECLRMVYHHMETKEIARVLGLSPDGVAQRIKTAMRILDVHRRRDAARLVIEAEGTDRLPATPPWALPEPATAAAAAGGPEHEPMRSGLREEQSGFDIVLPPPGLRLPLPLREARPNDAGWPVRLAWIAGIAIAGALAFGTLAAGVEALARLFGG